MKTCTKCKEELRLSKFHKDSATKDGYHTVCKDCRSIHYSDENAFRKERAVSHYGSACKHCNGVFNNAVYDFHHIDESTKEHSPSSLIQKTADFEAVKKELDKCLMLCANCHRIEHARIDEERYNSIINNREGSNVH